MTRFYVVSHRQVYLPEVRALSLLNPDDTALEQQIAGKGGYSELRAHYAVWKNLLKKEQCLSPNEQVGFFQFRRYLDLDSPLFSGCSACSGQKLPRPYCIRRLPEKGSFCEKNISRLAEYDLVAPLAEYTGQKVWDRYAASAGHRADDLRLACEILLNRHPQYEWAAGAYLKGCFEYYGNLYVMKAGVFDSYCAWLFGILEEFDQKAREIPPRTQGYLAERLFGLWYLHQYREGDFVCGELPRVHYWGYDDSTHHLRRSIPVNFLLPPGSRRRAAVRSLLKGYRR